LSGLTNTSLNDTWLTFLTNTTVYQNATLVRPPISRQKQEVQAWVFVTSSISVFLFFNNFLGLIVTWPKSSKEGGVIFLICQFVAVNLFMFLINIPISVVMVETTGSGHPNWPVFTHATMTRRPASWD